MKIISNEKSPATHPGGIPRYTNVDKMGDLLNCWLYFVSRFLFLPYRRRHWLTFVQMPEKYPMYGVIVSEITADRRIR